MRYPCVRRIRCVTRPRAHFSSSPRTWSQVWACYVAGHEALLNPVRAARDKLLAERDTRKWCLDRCLATGYCEAVEDLWKLTTQQVVQFCEKCAGEDACELAY